MVAVTVAFGTTAPEESFRVPVKAPVAAVWLKRAGDKPREREAKQVTAITYVRNDFKIPIIILSTLERPNDYSPKARIS